MVKFKPNEDRVLVEPEPVASQIGSIFIPDTAKDRPVKGTVTAVGEEITTYKPGDKVFYGKYAGTPIVIDGQEYLIMRKSDIFGAYEDVR